MENLSLSEYRSAMRDGCHPTHSGHHIGLRCRWYSDPNARLKVQHGLFLWVNRRVVDIEHLLNVMNSKHVDILLEKPSIRDVTDNLFKFHSFSSFVELQEVALIVGFLGEKRPPDRVEARSLPFSYESSQRSKRVLSCAHISEGRSRVDLGGGLRSKRIRSQVQSDN